jgi:hypothetical protein
MPGNLKPLVWMTILERGTHERRTGVLVAWLAGLARRRAGTRKRQKQLFARCVVTSSNFRHSCVGNRSSLSASSSG